MKVEEIKTKSDVHNYLNKPFISDNNNNKEQHHSSNKEFQSMLDDSIAEITKDEDMFIDAIDKEEMKSRRIQLMELRRARINIEQLKNNEETTKLK